MDDNALIKKPKRHCAVVWFLCAKNALPPQIAICPGLLVIAYRLCT